MESAPPQGARGARRPIRCLILTPTRELAAQVQESVREYGTPFAAALGGHLRGGRLRRAGGRRAARRIDILVATPGRLLDHVGQRTVDLSRVEIFVLDEADRMLDMGFIRDIRRVIEIMPARRQNLMFSATFTADIKQLAGTISVQSGPCRSRPSKSQESELVTQAVYPAHKDHKRDLLVHLLVKKRASVKPWSSSAPSMARIRLAKQLESSRASTPFPSTATARQNQRTRALADFKAGRARVLVATDIAARGLDIDQLPHVINFELPECPRRLRPPHRAYGSGGIDRRGHFVW